MEEILACDLIIIAAGAVRKPGMDRDALFQTNKPIIADYAARITRPNTKVIIVSEPVDLLTTYFARKSALPANKVMGVGGINFQLFLILPSQVNGEEFAFGKGHG